MSLTTDKSPLFQDIADIITQPKNRYNSAFECEIRVHTVDKDLDYKDGVAVNGIKIYRDYANNITDYTEVQVTCLLGTYVYDIYPYLDNLEVSIYLTRQEYINNKPVRIKERFKAVYLLDKNQNHYTSTSLPKDTLNQNLPIVLTLQLIDRSAEALRIKMVQGSFDRTINPRNKDMTPSSFIKSLISEHADKVLIENKPCIDVVNVEESDNKSPLRSITIPSGVRLVELGDYIQNKSDGVYNSGLGNYIQRFGKSKSETIKGFFVYSLFNGRKYHNSEYKIIIYVPPTSTYSITDVTYKYQDKTLRIVSNTNTAINDTKESLIMSTGGGYRSANANSFTKKPISITENGPSFSSSRLVTQVVYKDRPDGINFAPGKGVSSNHFAMTTDILQKAGKTIPLRITNMDPDFFYPGAGCKVVYEGKTKSVEELYGVIHRSIIQFQQPALNLQHSFTSPNITLNAQVDLEIFVSE